jgi:hypothetical protein
MTCRHATGDPSCSSHPDNVATRQYENEIQERARQEVAQRTPDPDHYEIIEAKRVGDHLVLKVLYPNCKRCAYEGNKVMVFLNVSETDVLKWKKIDPHFRATQRVAKEAPSPAARFPASPEGWSDAIEFAEKKT